MRAGVLPGVLMVAMGAWGQTPTTDAPVTTLTVTSRVVEISAVVLGKTGEPQGGLTKEDFVLKADGREAPIRYFTQGADLPLTLALVVDTSGSQRTFVSDEALASDVFFESMLTRPEDRAALIEVDTRVLQLKALTNSAEQLHLALSQMASDPKTGSATRLYDAIEAVSAQVLGKATGRKAIVLLTDGGENGSRATMEQAIAAAERANVQVYSVEYSAWNMFVPPPVGRSGGMGATVVVGPSGPHEDAGLKILQRLSESTGGRVFSVSAGTSLRSIYGRIAEDLRLQYEIGYTPATDLQPNSYHKLELRVRDRHLSVQARRGFFAAP